MRRRTITTTPVPRASTILDVGRRRWLATKHRRRHFQQQRQAFLHNTNAIRGKEEQQFGRFKTMNDEQREKKKDNEDEDSSHNAMRDSYQETSGNQYSAHLGCQDLLIGCAKRLGSNSNNNDASSVWKIADLGSADGSNSIRTLDVFLDAAAAAAAVVQNNRKEHVAKKFKDNSNSVVCDDNQRSSNTISSVHVVFEEHPSSDRAKLIETVASWAESRNNNTMDFTKFNNSTTKKAVVTHEILMKSFYEPLFEANSIDFCMSYICLHWLDSSCMSNDANSWKGLHLENTTANEESTSPKHHHGLDEFLQVNEQTAPPKLKSIWKEQLADPHLARFLELRSIELKPGAELLIVMVANPHEYWTPLSQEQSSSPLLRAMQECVSENSLRKEVLEKTVVPYYLREPQDVRDALALAKDRNLASNHPIHALELAELRKYETLTGGGDSNGSSSSSMLDGARELFWAIHGGTIQHIGGANDDEMQTIQNRLIHTFDETYNSQTGLVKGNFIAAVFRKGDAGQLQ